MILDAVLHEDLLTAALPAGVSYNEIARQWEPAEVPEGFLYSVNEDLTGRIGLIGETVPSTPETYTDLEIEISSDDPGLYGFSVLSDTDDPDVDEGSLTVEGEILGAELKVLADPLSLAFTKSGEPDPDPESLTLSSEDGLILLGSPAGSIDSPHFNMSTPPVGYRLFSGMAAEPGAVYYLHTDGRIDRNPYNAVRVIAEGLPDGSWRITE